MDLTFNECPDCIRKDVCIHKQMMDDVREKISNIVDDSNIEHDNIYCVHIECLYFIDEDNVNDPNEIYNNNR